LSLSCLRIASFLFLSELNTLLMSDVPNALLGDVALGVIEVVRIGAATSAGSRCGEHRGPSDGRWDEGTLGDATLGFNTGVSEWRAGRCGCRRDGNRSGSERRGTRLRLFVQIVVQAEVGR